MLNPLNRDSLMTPAAYMYVAWPVLIILCKWQWGSSADWVLYLWFPLTLFVAMLWNNLYLWREDDER